MSGPDTPLDNIASIDARLAELQEEMNRLRIARNSLIPFGRLPDELLVHVARYINIVPEAVWRLPPTDLYTMVSMFSRLRFLLISTPELWASIDCTWPNILVQRHLTRASCHVLTIKAEVDIFYRKSENIIRNNLLRLCSLTVASEPDLVMWHLEKTKSQTLRSIVVSNWGHYLNFGRQTLSPSISLTLSNLQLDSFSVSGFPALPALRSFGLLNTRCALKHLHKLLSTTTQLEELDISSMDQTDEDPILSTNCVMLPRLRSLVLSDDSSRIPNLLLMLPNPSKRFEVNHLSPGHAWNSIKEPSSIIIPRLRQFWATVTSGTMQFLPGTLKNSTYANCSNGQNPSLVFEGLFPLQDSGGPASFFFRPHSLITQEGSLLNLVHTISLSCSRRTKAGLDPGCINLDRLPNLKKLILFEVKRGPWVSVSEDEDLRQTLEEWILDRAGKGRPLERVEFYKCHLRARALYKSLLKTQAAHTVTWSDEAQPEESR